MSIVGIVNPVSGRGRAAEAWDKVRSRLKDSVTLVTRAPGHATELAAQAIKAGAETIVAVGGDGTINEVVNGFFERDQLISHAVMLGILPHGTGSDFQRMLHLPGSSEKAAALIQDRKPRPIDVLKVQYTNLDGSWSSRYSVNITSFGMGGVVASRVGRASKVLGGKTAFVLATPQTSMTFAGSLVTMSLDNSDPIEVKVTNVAVGNGRYHGGGMLSCPRAEIDDGLLDVTVVRFMRLPRLVGSLAMLYNGEIHSHPRVQFYRARCVRADSAQPTLIEIDGEPLGCLPIEISVVPRAIPILM